MKHVLGFFVSLLSFTFAHAQSPANFLEIKAQAWSAHCIKAGECGVPQALDLQIPTVKLKVALLRAPGESGSDSNNLQFTLADGRTLKIRFKIYNVWPHLNSHYPRYHQIQAEFLAPAIARCMTSVRYREPMEASPLICSAPAQTPQADGSFEEWGMTLEFAYTEN